MNPKSLLCVVTVTSWHHDTVAVCVVSHTQWYRSFCVQSTEHNTWAYCIRCFGAGAFPDPLADGSQIKGWDQEVFCTQSVAQEMQLKTILYLSYFCSLLIRRCWSFWDADLGSSKTEIGSSLWGKLRTSDSGEEVYFQLSQRILLGELCVPTSFCALFSS